MATSPKVTLVQFLAMGETKPYSEYACGEGFRSHTGTFHTQRFKSL